MPGLGEEIPFEQCVSEMALAGFEGCSVGDTVDTGHQVNYCDRCCKSCSPLALRKFLGSLRSHKPSVRTKLGV
jgi:hypothetical protein